MESQLIKEFNLPSYVKGKTFAEASKAIENKFSERTDETSKRTKDELMQRLAKAQEYTKMQSSLKANSQEVPDQMNGQIPEGFEEFGPQQPVQEMAEGGWAEMEGGEKAGAVAGMAGTALQLGNTAFGDTGIDTTGASGRGQAGSIGGATASGAVQGAAAGAALGPWGAAIGGVVGGAAGFLGGSKAKKDQLEANMNVGFKEHNQFTNDFAMGGPIKNNKKKLTERDTKEINKSTGVDFSDKEANRLFERTSSTTPSPLPQLDYGKYGNLNYFKASGMEGDELVINNTEANPHNASTINQNMDYLRKLNPNQKIKLNYNNFATGGPLDPPIKTPKQIAQDRMFSGVDDFQVPSLNLTYPQSYPPTKSTPVQQRPKVEGINSISANVQKEVQGASLSSSTYKNPVKKVAGDYMIEGDAGDNKKGSGLDYGSILRTAPIVSNALQLANLEKPNKITLDRLDSKYKPDYVDEKSLETRVQNEANNTTRGLANASNGSQGALRTNLLGSQLQKTSAMSDAFMKADGINRGENTKKQEFDNRNDIYNQRQGTVEQQMNDQNEGAYSSAKSALQSQLATDIGNFGKEKVNMKQVAEMYGYKWDGTYMRDDKGNIVDPKKLKNENK